MEATESCQNWSRLRSADTTAPQNCVGTVAFSTMIRPSATAIQDRSSSIMTRSLDVIVFPGGFNLPIWAGTHVGAFARQDLEIRLHFTTNSMQQLSGLVRGEWEIGLTGFDNVV